MGVKDQLEHARTFASARDYCIVAEHCDNDISAFRGANRPAYQQVLALARERKIDRVIVYHLTRMTRNRVNWSRVHRLVPRVQGQRRRSSGRRLRPIDSGRPQLGGYPGRVGDLGIRNQIRARHRRRGTARAVRPAIRSSWIWVVETRHRIHGDLAEHPHEADVVREVVDRLLAGESLRGVTDRLRNHRGETAPSRHGGAKHQSRS